MAANAARGGGAARGEGAAVAAVLAAKVATAIAVLALGFSHVSDDDFARVVIAQAFAHTPRLDPSGTSWLPLPFWATGSAMLAFGRSLVVARVVAIGAGALGVAAVYVGMRGAKLGRAVALAAIGLGLAVPLEAWLGAATVPDGPTGALIAAGALAMGARGTMRVGGAALLLAASLSRYEAWPVCAVAAVAALARRDVGTAVLAGAGPAAWLVWNRWSHGDATHFFVRVARYRAAIGAEPAGIGARLAGFPRAFVEHAPLLVLAGALGAAILVAHRDRRLVWAWMAGATMLASLTLGDVLGGAPTHHPERALLALDWILAATAAAGGAHLGRPLRAVALAAAAAGIVLSVRAWPDMPGRGDDARVAQLARGRYLRDGGAQRLAVRPCRYEHFALIAAFEAPERVRTLPPEPAPACPTVTLEE